MTRAAAIRTSGSDLAVLVETEARLDRALADARAQAAAIREAARDRAKAASQALDGMLDRERARITAAVAASTEAQLAAIATKARGQITCFEATRAERLDPIARELASRIVALALEETP